MKKLFSAMACLVLAACAVGPGPPTFVNNSSFPLVAYPSNQDVARVFPRRALDRGIRGRVVLQCQVQEDGALANCTVFEETPPEMGFGAAALRLAPLVRFGPTFANGEPTANRWIRMPMGFGYM